jgi:hypothetical protein
VNAISKTLKLIRDNFVKGSVMSKQWFNVQGRQSVPTANNSAAFERIKAENAANRALNSETYLCAHCGYPVPHWMNVCKCCYAKGER